MGGGDSVHGTGARRAHCVDCEPAILEQLIEHAPGECAMRASTLQRQVYWFLIVIGPHPGERPITRVMTARFSSTCAPAIASLLDQLVVTNRVGRGALFMPRNCANCVVMGSASIHS